MMKRLSALVLLIIYCVASVGMVVHLHYCRGKLDRISITANHERECKRVMPVHHKGCCSDKKISIKIIETHYASSGFVQVPTVVKNIPVHLIYHELLFTLSKNLTVYNNNNISPGSGQVSVYLFNRVFRI